MKDSFALTPEPIESGAGHAQDAAGGYVVFEGRVRNRNEGRDVLSLEYEAFGEMAIKTGNEVVEEACAQFQILDARCIHRTGHLQIGDIAIRVEVASAHRKAAFEACDWIVDEIKKRVPIWKKEHYTEGDSGWINCAPAGELPVDSKSNSDEEAYYSRQVTLKEVGPTGQAKLKAARVLVVGAGGLGSPALLYLAAAGVGTLGIAEFDSLDTSNLHRQILYSSKDVGRSKTDAAVERLRNLNPHIRVVGHEARVTSANVHDLLADYDLVIDGTDNFRTKFLLNDACVAQGKSLIQSSIYQVEGHVLVIGPGTPCLRCLWPETPSEGCVGNCAEVGVLGVVPGIFGAIQANEAIKLILGLPSPLRQGKMLMLNLLSYSQQLVSLDRDPSCPSCGDGSASEEEGFEVGPDETDFSRYVVIDVREPYELRMQPFKAAMNLPSTRFDLSRLPEADRYLLVCAHGVRSANIAFEMRERGDRRFLAHRRSRRTSWPITVEAKPEPIEKVESFP